MSIEKRCRYPTARYADRQNDKLLNEHDSRSGAPSGSGDELSSVITTISNFCDEFKPIASTPMAVQHVTNTGVDQIDRRVATRKHA